MIESYILGGRGSVAAFLKYDCFNNFGLKSVASFVLGLILKMKESA